MDPLPPLIKHKSTEFYYTSTAWAIEKSTHTQGRQTPANQAQIYRALLDQDNMSYWEIETYPGQIDTTSNSAQVYRALLDQDSISFEKSTHTQGRQTPHKLSTILHSPTTPG